MGLDPIREVGLERSTYAEYVYDENDILRNKYTVASEIALCYLYDSWIIHDYAKFLDRQAKNNVSEDIAPNGIHYEMSDILGYESKGYTKDEAIDLFLQYDPKYTTVIDWDTVPPNRLDLEGSDMDPQFMGEQYRFIMEYRYIGFKQINTLPYDKILVQVYKKLPTDTDYTHVAKVAYYYYSSSRYILRYCNIFDDDDNEIIDVANITEYNIDKYARDGL